MQITSLIDEWAPDMIIVGMPVHADGQAHTLRDEIERFRRRLNGRYKLPVEFVDERLSSCAAAAESSVSGELDAGAAKMILLTWLEQQPLRASGNAP
jgi:putative Holliday junction resolvase